MDFQTKAQEVIKIEHKAVLKQLAHIDENFNHICNLLFQNKGKIIIVGMGKSGHVGRKIAATLASTGSPAFFIHATEALHGDLGMINASDIVIAISNSGKSPEILTLLPILRQLKITVIAMTGNAESSLAISADYHISTAVDEEACPLGLAPTASTTATLVMGDAIAVSLLSARKFTKEEFALSHPAGNLGKRLLLKVSDLMHTGPAIPKVMPHMSLAQALIEMTGKRLGMTTIVDQADHLLGVFTDGDLRRTIQEGVDLHGSTMESIMIKNPKYLQITDLASFAFDLMETYKITSLPVLNEESQIKGVLHLHDLLAEGL